MTEVAALVMPLWVSPILTGMRRVGKALLEARGTLIICCCKERVAAPFSIVHSCHRVAHALHGMREVTPCLYPIGIGQ